MVEWVRLPAVLTHPGRPSIMLLTDLALYERLPDCPPFPGNRHFGEW
jgi:hypothetical protein